MVNGTLSRSPRTTLLGNPAVAPGGSYRKKQNTRSDPAEPLQNLTPQNRHVELSAGHVGSTETKPSSR